MSEFATLLTSVFQFIFDMAWWESFQKLEYSNELLVVFGGLLLFTGVVKIIRSGFKMLLWVVLCGIGLSGVLHGLNKTPDVLDSYKGEKMSAYVGTGKELSTEMLQLLCEKHEKGKLSSLY